MVALLNPLKDEDLVFLFWSSVVCNDILIDFYISTFFFLIVDFFADALKLHIYITFAQKIYIKVFLWSDEIFQVLI